MLEPCDGKLSRTVLKGEWGCKAPDLLDALEITRDYKDLERTRWQRLAEIHHARAGLAGNIRNAVP